jgi:hypothetical protein
MGMHDDILLSLERVLVNPAALPEPDLVDRAIATRDAEVLGLVEQVISVLPATRHGEPLWAIVRDKRAGDEVRVAALHALTMLLVTSIETLEDASMGLADEDEEPLFEADEIEEHLERILALYRDQTESREVRRRALESAANLTDDESVGSAGLAALASKEPSWVVTGLLVVRLQQGSRARKHIETALKHDALEVRLEAIRGLADLGERHDVEALETIVRKSTNHDERVTALYAMSEMPRQDAGQALYDLIEVLDEDGEIIDDVHEAYELWLEEWGSAEGLEDGFVDDIDEAEFDHLEVPDDDDDDIDEDDDDR